MVGQPLGSFQLKGVPEMELIQCRSVREAGHCTSQGEEGR